MAATGGQQEQSPPSAAEPRPPIGGISAPRGKRMVVDLSSLPLQILLFLDIYYFIFLWICELLLYIYKGSILPYPNQGGILALEIIWLFLLAAIETLRIYFGYKGNLSERKISVIFSILLSVPVVFTYLYLILWQTYVLRVEVILCSISLIMMALQIILSAAAVLTFQRHESFIRR